MASNSWLSILLIIGDSGFGKSSSLFNLISHQPAIDKIHLYAKVSYQAKYQLLINERENTRLTHLNDFKAFIEYSKNMDDIYKNIEEYNPNKKAKALNLLLVALCSFTFCSLLVSFFPLPVTFCLLLITFFSLLVIFLSKWPWNKMTLNCKKWLDYNETPSQIFYLQISEILITFPGSWFSKFSQHVKPFSMLT